MSLTSGEYSKTSTLQPPTSAGPVTVGEEDDTGVVVSVGLLLVVDGEVVTDGEEETPSVGVATGCVLGVFLPAMMIPATTRATTMRAPMSAQAQPGRPRRPACGVAVFGRPFVPDVMVVCGWRSGLVGCCPAGGGVVMGSPLLLRTVGRYRSSVVAGWLLADGWVLEGVGGIVPLLLACTSDRGAAVRPR